MKLILLFIVRAYQLLISPVLPQSCRFSPSCSQYSLEAISKYGAFKGFWLTIKRLIRCNPWNPGGYDPVP
ncbi:membrane protein insertion efficiency factor YidD [Sideroxydans sp. CL21]|uniref:membrane protein insertion efficiency factor YidD n=1 Tax=Sideroxydans sp. CL21 TaxID=2600596 RepID=UPI0024BD4733|nr:membrane protein insertion efficiency factor YidD [Sideroxydans sp. CL21]